MNRSMLILISLLPAMFAGVAQPRQLTTFAELMPALKSGAEVRAVIEYAKCRLVIDRVETKAPEAVGGMSFANFEYFGQMVVRNPKPYVATSQTVLISHPRYGYVLNYVKIKIIEDSKVEIVARYLNPGTYQVVMDEIFYGALSAGEDGNGVKLFVR